MTVRGMETDRPAVLRRRPPAEVPRRGEVRVRLSAVECQAVPTIIAAF
jgi:hypothetical protein